MSDVLREEIARREKTKDVLREEIARRRELKERKTKVENIKNNIRDKFRNFSNSKLPAPKKSPAPKRGTIVLKQKTSALPSFFMGGR